MAFIERGAALQAAVLHGVDHFFNRDIEYLSVVEMVEEIVPAYLVDEEFYSEVYDEIHRELDTLYQRWLDSDK